MPLAFAANSNLFFGSSGMTTTGYSNVEETAETIFMGDAGMLSGTTVNRYNILWVPSGTTHLHARHGGEFANISWLDGHSKSHKLYYHTVNIQGADYKALKDNHLGDLLKFPERGSDIRRLVDARSVLLFARQALIGYRRAIPQPSRVSMRGGWITLWTRQFCVEICAERQLVPS